MATTVPLPSLSPTMKEGKITKWLNKEGDKVSSGEAIAEVETDKSNLEIEAYDDGYLLRILVKEGESAPVGAPIAYIGEKGEKVEAREASAAPAKPSEPAPSPKPAERAPPPKPAEPRLPIEMKRPPQPSAEPSRPAGGQVLPLRREEAASANGRLRASPLARKIAEDQGLDLSAVQGS